MRGVLGVVAADVEEVAHVVGLEHVDDAREIFVQPLLEFVPAGADPPAAGEVPQQSDLFVRSRGQIDQLFLRTPSMPKFPAKTVPKVFGSRRQVSTIPRNELLMTQVGPRIGQRRRYERP